MNKGFWMAGGPGGLSEGGEMAYDNSSRVEPKRSQQWFIDGTEAELLPNKKHAVEVPNHTSFSELLNSNISPWGNASSFQSVAGQFTERLFDLETVRTINFDYRDNPSVGVGSMNLGRKVIEDPFGSDSSFGLSISHSLEDPISGLNYGGIRKVKVSQFKDSENFISGSVGHGYGRGDNTMSASHAYRMAGDTSVTMGLLFNKGDENVISGSETFNRADGNFISMGQSYDKGDNSHISMGQTYKEDNTDISMGYSFVKDENNVMIMRETFTKDKDTISMSHTFKDNNDDVHVGQPFSKVDSSIISMGQTFNKGSDNTISIGHTYNNVDDNTMSIRHMCNKMDDNDLSMRHCLSKGESTIISFDGLNDDDDSNPSGRLICSYDFLMGQSSVRSSKELNETGLIDANADVLANAAQMTNPGDSFSKKKVEQKANKKAPPNNFPSNVRSLLSTGMLDGVPVKYIAWSREKELRGIIKGSGYLCSCQSCNLSKAINAYEFERHAGCKTKHPNNHIYFENGKTVYGIVQELRNTPQNLLFEVIQTITGSPINQKSFRLWKESFLAATRELQRIYGKEEGKQLFQIGSPSL